MLRSNIPPLFFSSNEWQTIFDVVLYNRLLSIWMIMNCKVPNKYKVCVLRMEAKGLQFDINGMERLFEFACHRRLILHLRLCCYNLNAILFSFSLSLFLSISCSSVSFGWMCALFSFSLYPFVRFLLEPDEEKLHTEIDTKKCEITPTGTGTWKCLWIDWNKSKYVFVCVPAHTQQMIQNLL